MKREGCSPLPIVALSIVGLLWVLVTGIPLLLWRLSPPFIDSTYGGGHQPFELLGLFLSVLALGTAGWLAHRKKPDSPLLHKKISGVLLCAKSYMAAY